MTYNPYLSPTTVEGEPISPPIVFWDDFTDGWGAEPSDADNTGKFSETANLGQWLVTVIDDDSAGDYAIICDDSATGGWLKFTVASDIIDVLSMQLNGEAFKMGTGKTMIFEIRVKFTDVDDCDWFVGLAATDTAILTGVADKIGFECPDATGDIDAVTENSTNQTTTDTTVDLVNDTWVTLRFEVKGTGKARFYVDGALKATHTANLPNDVYLTPSVELGSASEGVESIYIDYILVWLER